MTGNRPVIMIAVAISPLGFFLARKRLISPKSGVILLATGAATGGRFSPAFVRPRDRWLSASAYKKTRTRARSREAPGERISANRRRQTPGVGCERQSHGLWARRACLSLTTDRLLSVKTFRQKARNSDVLVFW
jgi:hypothetical protein